MNKLEQKLIELGYELYDEILNVYIKKVYVSHYIAIFVNDIENSRVWTKKQQYYNEKDIDTLTQALKQMQKDLEELRKYET